MPLITEGIRQAESFGRRLREELVTGEIVSFLYAPTRRAHETATVIHDTVAATLDDATDQQCRLLPPIKQWAIRNPDIYVAGTRIDLVSSAEAVAEQLPLSSLRPEELRELPFLRGFWSEPDRIGYWVNHPNPPGEDADTVARRLLTFARSFLDLPREQPRRYICVTHSTTMRAFLRRYLLGKDPGEPGYLESVDLSFAPDGSLTIHFREHSRDVVWQP
jgi:broad specificity phosphatase PhoE